MRKAELHSVQPVHQHKLVSGELLQRFGSALPGCGNAGMEVAAAGSCLRPFLAHGAARGMWSSIPEPNPLISACGCTLGNGLFPVQRLLGQTAVGNSSSCTSDGLGFAFRGGKDTDSWATAQTRSVFPLQVTHLLGGQKNAAVGCAGEQPWVGVWEPRGAGLGALPHPGAPRGNGGARRALIHCRHLERALGASPVCPCRSASLSSASWRPCCSSISATR